MTIIGRIATVTTGVVAAAGTALVAAPADAATPRPTHVVTCAGTKAGAAKTVTLSVPTRLKSLDGARRYCSWMNAGGKRIVIVDTAPKHGLKYLSKKAVKGKGVSDVTYRASAKGFGTEHSSRLTYVLSEPDVSFGWKVVLVQDHGVRLWWATPVGRWDADKPDFRRTLGSVRVDRG